MENAAGNPWKWGKGKRSPRRASGESNAGGETKRFARKKQVLGE